MGHRKDGACGATAGPHVEMQDSQNVCPQGSTSRRRGAAAPSCLHNGRMRKQRIGLPAPDGSARSASTLLSAASAPLAQQQTARRTPHDAHASTHLLCACVMPGMWLQ
jgi:hypothetical protein